MPPDDTVGIQSKVNSFDGCQSDVIFPLQARCTVAVKVPHIVLSHQFALHMESGFLRYPKWATAAHVHSESSTS